MVLVGAPGISFGFYSVGFKEDVTTYNVMHLMVQKALPIGGYVAAGVYHGLNTDSDLQPGGSKYLWSVQLDIDLPLGR